jgi:uncharacterized membrane protein YdjX (TVP38/TMEM64 family)
MKRFLNASRWMLLVVLAAAGLLVCGLAWWWLRRQGIEPRAVLHDVLEYLRGVGPLTFFTLMALLPSVGAPLSIFTLVAGPVFTPTLGLPLVMLFALVSLAVNIILTYALARWLMRPVIKRLCVWLGFEIPVVRAEDQRSLILLVRVAPGTPFMLQSYLLGAAGIAFMPYLIISWTVNAVQVCPFIYFGGELVHGRAQNALLALSLLAVFPIGVRYLRLYLKWKKASATV